MKKASSKKIPHKAVSKKRNFLNSTNIRWFGVDIHHIAIGVSFVGCVVALLLVQKQKTIEEQVLAAQTDSATAAVPYVRVGGISCIPRPPCLDSVPRCELAEPAGGWCPSPSSGTPTPSITPSEGCFYKKICLMIMCSRNNPNCQQCHQLLICPSGVPPITCPPTAACPPGKMCPQIMKGCYPNITPPVRPSCEPVPTCDSRLGIPCKLPCGITPPPHPTCTVNPTCEPGKACSEAIIGCTPIVSPKITGSVPVSGQTSANTFQSNPVTSFFRGFVSKFFSWF